MKQKYGIISRITFWIGVVLGAYGYIRIYVVQKNLPAGVCPIEDNRPVLYVAIGFMIISIVLSFIDDKKKKEVK